MRFGVGRRNLLAAKKKQPRDKGCPARADPESRAMMALLVAPGLGEAL